MKNSDLPAMPNDLSVQDISSLFGDDWQDGDGVKARSRIVSGLTKREYIAAMAMQGLISNGDHLKLKQDGRAIGLLALHYAESLLERIDEAESGGDK